MKELKIAQLTENQKKFLDVFALQRFHSIISNLTEVGFVTDNFFEVKKEDLELLKKAENREEFFKQVLAYHSKKLMIYGSKVNNFHQKPSISLVIFYLIKN